MARTTANTKRRRRRLSGGQALLAVLLLTLMVYLLGIVSLGATLRGYFFSHRSKDAGQAQVAAEAAIDFGMAVLNATVPQTPGAALVPLPAYFDAGEDRHWTYVDARNEDFFARQLMDVTPTLTIRIPDQVPVPHAHDEVANYRILEAEAVVAGAVRRARAIAVLQGATTDVPQPVFSRAVLARGNVTAQGGLNALRTDSFDAELGAYGGGNRGTGGHVHANGSILGAATYHGRVTATGTVDPHVAVVGEGNTIAAGVPVDPIPPVPTMPAATPVAWTCPGTVSPAPGEVVDLGVVSLSGDSTQVLTLMPGRYVLSRLAITGQARLTVAGSGLTEIFIDGDVLAAGNGIVNDGRLPANLRLIAGRPGSRVDLAGNGAFYGTVLAPGSTVTIGGNGEVFGALIGDSVTFNGASSIVHYDQASARGHTFSAHQPLLLGFRLIALDVPQAGD